jgi:hypothetical protein
MDWFCAGVFWDWEGRGDHMHGSGRILVIHVVAFYFLLFSILFIIPLCSKTD